MPMIRISDEQHAALSAAAKQNGLTLTKLVSIIFDIALLGIPLILRKWRKAQQQEPPHE